MSSGIKSPQKIIFLLSLSLLVVVIALSFWNSRAPSVSPPQELFGVLRPEPKPLTSFKLIDQNRTPFNKERLLDKWTFLFFGYTYCPDICPSTLSVLSMVYNELDEGTGEKGETQVLFVSVDPERDTPEKLSGYMAYFNKEYIAVTGEKSDIDSFAQQNGARYILEQETSPGEYLVSHTSAIFLIGPQARLVATFSQPHDAATILEQYRKISSYMK